MNLALLSDTYPPDVGGLARSAERLALLLAANGHAIRVFAPSRSVPPGQIMHTTSAGVTISRVGMHQRPTDTLNDWFNALLAAHAEQPFDLLHAYFVTQAGFVAVYAGRYLHIPNVVSARGNDIDRAVFDPSKASHTLYALQHADALTANSRDLVRRVAALVPGRVATHIPNGVDTRHFAPAPPNWALLADAEGLTDEQRARIAERTVPLLGFVGEARAKKGLAPLLLAFRAVARQQPAALLLVGGVRSGDDNALLAVFRKQNPALPLGVVPYVPRTTLPSYYNLLDLLLLPSLQDGLPNALLEGMACERAIVASTAGGIPDVVQHGENGVLVPPRDSDALAAAALALLPDPANRARLGAAARATVLRDHAPDQELARNLAVYHQLLERKHDL